MNSHTYIVRVWSEPNPGGPSGWRASVMDASSQQRWYFSSPNLLVNFMLEASHTNPETEPEDSG